MTKLLGPESRKFNPKLRMIANCSVEVNTLRSEQCAAMGVERNRVTEAIPVLREDESIAGSVAKSSEQTARPKLKQLAKGVLVNVFIEMQDNGAELPQQLSQQAYRANLVAATLHLDELPEIAAHESVLYIEMGEPLATPTPEIAPADGQVPDPARWQVASQVPHRDGEGVLIGIIDVQGFDFAHPDFLDENGQTRFVRIWDQGGSARPNPHKTGPKRYDQRFDFGAEFHQKHLNQALAAADELQLPAQEIERQSQMTPSSHGTHVASIAGGNHGVCRKAMLAGVLIDLAEDDEKDRRLSFYDSTRIAHAVDYLILLAGELKVPVSINISLGTNGHAHDGTGSVSRWLDAAMAAPGRCLCVAAGNAGQEVAAFPGDVAYVMGRIHTSGQVAGRFAHQDIAWEVVGNGTVDVSENELEIWYSEQDRFAVSLRPPTPGADWIGPVDPLQFIENEVVPVVDLPGEPKAGVKPTGSVFSIYNELYHPANGSNYLALYLTPFFGKEQVVGVPAGTWTVRLHGRDVRDGRYHGWIERDDPRRLGRIGVREAWRYPSFFTEASNVDNSSVGSLACGRRVIAVANLHEAEERVNLSSSQGPTRDNRNKPDVAAPGTDMLAANGFAGPDNPWVRMTGTSMASPFVAGVAGLMLAVEPRLTAAQIEGILHRTSRPLPGRSFAWTNDAGFGRINPAACLAEAHSLNQRTEKKL